ncbi:hypothetical protein [Endozoicomonas elysicola]|uniref:Uncharacterized protein n=1 Tax=Endozoicomonas elysicola TaxID=305900 RepID=A0A081K7Q3_9GAMM|nr:hypothetical protein [Endozoicomonas elysicola]KEI70179.1 hypothetical protein GV64_04955 [Endozoicomonas elysicola]
MFGYVSGQQVFLTQQNNTCLQKPGDIDSSDTIASEERMKPNKKKRKSTPNTPHPKKPKNEDVKPLKIDTASATYLQKIRGFLNAPSPDSNISILNRTISYLNPKERLFYSTPEPPSTCETPTCRTFQDYISEEETAILELSNMLFGKKTLVCETIFKAAFEKVRELRENEVDNIWDRFYSKRRSIQTKCEEGLTLERTAEELEDLKRTLYKRKSLLRPKKFEDKVVSKGIFYPESFKCPKPNTEKKETTVKTAIQPTKSAEWQIEETPASALIDQPENITWTYSAHREPPRLLTVEAEASEQKETKPGTGDQSQYLKDGLTVSGKRRINSPSHEPSEHSPSLFNPAYESSSPEVLPIELVDNHKRKSMTTKSQERPISTASVPKSKVFPTVSSQEEKECPGSKNTLKTEEQESNNSNETNTGPPNEQTIQYQKEEKGIFPSTSRNPYLAMPKSQSEPSDTSDNESTTGDIEQSIFGNESDYGSQKQLTPKPDYTYPETEPVCPSRSKISLMDLRGTSNLRLQLRELECRTPDSGISLTYPPKETRHHELEIFNSSTIMSKTQRAQTASSAHTAVWNKNRSLPALEKTGTQDPQDRGCLPKLSTSIPSLSQVDTDEYLLDDLEEIIEQMSREDRCMTPASHPDSDTACPEASTSFEDSTSTPWSFDRHQQVNTMKQASTKPPPTIPMNAASALSSLASNHHCRRKFTGTQYSKPQSSSQDSCQRTQPGAQSVTTNYQKYVTRPVASSVSEISRTGTEYYDKYPEHTELITKHVNPPYPNASDLPVTITSVSNQTPSAAYSHPVPTAQHFAKNEQFEMVGSSGFSGPHWHHQPPQPQDAIHSQFYNQSSNPQFPPLNYIDLIIKPIVSSAEATQATAPSINLNTQPLMGYQFGLQHQNQYQVSQQADHSLLHQPFPQPWF